MSALLLIDVQNDFMPFGALPVARRRRRSWGSERDHGAGSMLVVATQDWHPAGPRIVRIEPSRLRAGGRGRGRAARSRCCGRTTASSGVAGRIVSLGARRRGDRCAWCARARDPAIDSYSGFFDNGHLKDTGLGSYLAERGVTEVWIAGVATDYCVKYTALDARSLGLPTVVVVDGCRGVDLNPGDVDAALAEMRAAGCEIVTSSEV